MNQPFEKIKTWKAACKVAGVSPTNLPKVGNLPKPFQKWIIATYMMGIIVKALNTDEQGKTWEPNWNNSDELKYNAWFEIKATDKKPAGVGFSRTYYVSWSAFSGVGSRLCFQSSDRVLHAQKYFKKIFMDMMIIPSTTKSTKK